MSDLPPVSVAASDAQPPPAPGAAPAAAPGTYEKIAADPSMPKMYPKPVTMLVIGMAGSGKTTLMQVHKTHVFVLVVCMWLDDDVFPY